MIGDNIWDMILGKSGKLAGPVAPELVELAKSQGREFLSNDPQDNYPDCLDSFREKMKAQGWELGQDEEELFEYAMHPTQYEAYKSGKAKADFLEDLAKRKAEKNTPAASAMPSVITVNVNGQNYKLDIAYGDAVPAATEAAASAAPAGAGEDIIAPLSGKFYLTKEPGEQAKKVGDAVKKGDTLCYIEAMKVNNAISAEFDGVITAICLSNGDSVDEDDVIFKVARS